MQGKRHIRHENPFSICRTETIIWVIFLLVSYFLLKLFSLRQQNLQDMWHSTSKIIHESLSYLSIITNIGIYFNSSCLTMQSEFILMDPNQQWWIETCRVCILPKKLCRCARTNVRRLDHCLHNCYLLNNFSS